MGNVYKWLMFTNGCVQATMVVKTVSERDSKYMYECLTCNLIQDRAHKLFHLESLPLKGEFYEFLLGSTGDLVTNFFQRIPTFMYGPIKINMKQDI